MNANVLLRFVRWAMDKEPCVVAGCPRAAGSDGTCFRHEVNAAGQVTLLSKDGLTGQRITARLREE